jgi:hypothetical protein
LEINRRENFWLGARKPSLTGRAFQPADPAREIAAVSLDSVTALGRGAAYLSRRSWREEFAYDAHFLLSWHLD